MQYATPALNAIATFDNAGHFIRRAIEVSAEILNEVIIDLSLSAIESGIIVRRWYENSGKDQIAELGWNALRLTALLILFVACLACVTGFAIGAAWRGAKAAWAWINKATDDGLGLYGPSPMLAAWRQKPTVEVVVIDDIPELDLSEGEALINWAFSLKQ
ncbi:hypothetical protein [Adonisia turfae]|uniref:Uncharacterized protein n=1 Tax=Adonisia turfae CCMR0081 TaxID=2292702 RepID=A0A6M0RT87_9CYAN|nr:hypothetical protein [Adonisia turfae]NEZ59468.1 hypothetical protein [Adonisia turfae CCMR0081]